jgi:hypothetical protein
MHVTKRDPSGNFGFEFSVADAIPANTNVSEVATIKDFMTVSFYSFYVLVVFPLVSFHSQPSEASKLSILIATAEPLGLALR